MRKILHLVRHGQAAHNIRAEAKRAAGCSMQEFMDQMTEDDVFDAPLTEMGLQQTSDAATRVRQTAGFAQVELITSSPLWRALQTADFVLPQPGLPRVCLEQLRERKGVLECCQRRSASQLKAQWPNWDFKSLAEEGGPLSSELEGVRECAERGYDGLRLIWARPEANVALVAHGGFLKHLLNDHPRISADVGLKGRFENCEVRSCVLELGTLEGTDASDVPGEPGFRLSVLPRNATQSLHAMS